MKEKLKKALFMNGQEAIEDFLGYEISPEEEKDVTDDRMDEVFNQMPDEELRAYFDKYVFHPYYFTFGSNEKFAYQNGWVVIHAENESQARNLFRILYPGENKDDLLMCGFVYDEESWKETSMCKENSNLDGGCHCNISLAVSFE